MPKDKIKDLEGLEGVYDVLMSEDFFEEMDADTLLLDSLESRYEAGDPLGEGGVKSISSSYDLVCQRKVARAILKDKKKLSGRFINEARILSRLEHSNIVPLYDLGLDENKEVYFTMRLLDGENLREKINLLRDQKMNWAKSRSYFLEVFLKVCDALSYAHSKGVVHLDLKPSNIQIEDFGEVLVYDWGLACDLKNKGGIHSVSTTEVNEKHYTVDGQIKGTPGYMAPEQADPSLGQCNEQTDVYSLGALLYTLLTYKVPIEAMSLEETLSKTASGDFCEPRLAQPEARLPTSLNAVVMKAMALKASDRYQSVEDLSDEIRAYLSGFATHAEQASFLTLARLMLKRYRRIFITLLLALMLILVLSGLFLERLQEEKTAVENNLLRSQKAEREVSALRDEAVILVDALKQEKADGRKMRRKLMPKLTWMVYTHQNQERFEQAAILAKSLYQLEPTNQEVKRAYAYTLFGEYKFSEVLQVLRNYKGHENIDFLRGFAKRAAEIQGISDFVKVVKDLQFRPSHLRKNLDLRLLYSMSEHFSPHEQIEIARHFMAKRGGCFELIEQKGLYALSLKNNKSFESLIYLRGLPLESLNLSNSVAYDLMPLSDMPLKQLILSGSRVLSLRDVNLPDLEYLDIYDTQINGLSFLKNTKIQILRLNDIWCDLRVLNNCKNLQEVTLPKGLYSPTHLKSLQPKVKVIFE